MRILIQRVKQASVTIDDKLKSAIKGGMLILVGIEDADTDEDIEWLCGKIVKLRIFDDDNGVMNLSISDLPDLDILVVSQFTLHASTKKGNRPSFINAQKPDTAKELYEYFCEVLNKEIPVKTGVFGADMQIENCCDGPVTIILNTDIWNKK